ncbi:MAG TPA: PASTA domain-containing protein [Candidatus Competibacter sp.]|nr:PASTA domain-containing protein [Candidatus Competibacter sp.]
MRSKIGFLSASFILLFVGLIFSFYPQISLAATVPDNMVGNTEAQARAAITGVCGPGAQPDDPPACLKVAVTYSFDPAFAAGIVISLNPASGADVPSDTTVNLVVSNRLIVPNVVGESEQAATLTINNTCVPNTTQCLKAAAKQEENPAVPAGNVIRQDPNAGFQTAAGSTVNIFVSSGSKTVPDVVGQSLESAKTAIEGADLKLGTISLTASDTAPAGTVISQTPSGGSPVVSGSAVNLTVSSGLEKPTVPPVTPGDIPVPDVKGLTKAAASTIIRNSGLLVGAIIQKYDEAVPAGTVIDQSPAAGSNVAAGTAVTLTVSLGPAGVVKVPDVKGLSEEAAKSILLNAGLTIGKVQRQPDPTMSPGNVIGTDPAAGEQVKIGSAVDLIVSDGLSQPQQCAVPDVVNQTVDDAREILFATCLSGIGSVTVQANPTVPAGRVAVQFPAVGTLIGYNTTVNLVISSGAQPPVETPKVIGMTLADATVVLNNVGLTVGHVSRQTSNTVPEGRIISQNPLMTAQAPIGWPVNLVVSLGPIPEDPGARPQTVVPDLAGQTLATATAKLIEAGLRVGLVANERNQDVPVGQVSRQSPAKETTLPVNSRVNLTISFGPYAYGVLSGPAYITNYSGGTVSIIDPATDKLVDNIPSGIGNTGPSGIAVHPDGTKLFVVNRPQFGRSTGSVSVINLIDRRVMATIPVGAAPLGVAVNPTGERVFVTNEGSFSLSVIDTATNQPHIDLNVPNLAVNSFPRGVAVHPNPLRPLVYVVNRTVNSFSDDGTNPYVDQCDSLVARPPVNVNPDQCVGSLSIFDIDLKRQVGSVAVGWAPEGVAVHPDGNLVYVANSGDRTISIMETVFNRVIGVIKLDEFGGAPQPLVPRGVAVSADGNRLYVTDGAGNRLFVIDTTANHAVVGIVPVGKKPYGVAVSQDSKRVYIANTDDNTVTVVDGQSGTVIATIPVGLAPWAFGQFVGPLATVAKPVFDPPAGSVRSPRAIKISTATPDASIRYTTDGSIPTSTHGTLLKSGQTITVTSLPNQDGTFVLKAVAFKDNWADSEVAEATYAIRFSGNSNP